MILLNSSNFFVLFEYSYLYSDIIIIISFGKTNYVKIFLIELSKCLKCLKTTGILLVFVNVLVLLSFVL